MRHVVITDVNGYRLDLARRMGATVAADVSRENLADVQRSLGMKEGFDIWHEMSGSPAAFQSMIEHMCHGGKMAMLGIPSEPIVLDRNRLTFNKLTIRGIYGRVIEGLIKSKSLRSDFFVDEITTQ